MDNKQQPDKIPSAEEYLIQHLINRCEGDSVTKPSDEEIAEILDDSETIALVQMVESYALLREQRAVDVERKEWQQLVLESYIENAYPESEIK